MGCGHHGRSFYPYGRPYRDDYPRSNYPNTNYQTEKKPESAVDILKKRLANGEITPDQYAEMLEVITGEVVKNPSTKEQKLEEPVKQVVKKIKAKDQDKFDKNTRPSVSLSKKRKG